MIRSAKLRSVTLMMAAVVLMGATLILGGCAGDGTSASDVRRNWAPELRNLNQHPEMHKAARARSVQTNRRMFWNDLDRVLLIDRPSSLSQWDVPR